MAMNNRLLRPRASGAFNPKSISGLLAWYDATVPSSITVATGVSNWANLEGTASRDLQQTTGNNQPVLTANVFGNKSALLFDGVNDSMVRAFTVGKPCHEFVVFSVVTLNRNNAITDGSSFGTKMLWLNSSNQPQAYQAIGITSLTGLSANVATLADTEFNNANSVLRINGSQVASGNTGANTPDGMTVGRWGGQTVYGNIYVSEILLFNRLLASTEASRVRRYLSSKYGVVVA
ncbi:MAG: hypothetical protein ACKOC8_09370 [Pirellulales bacterium]